MVEITLSGPFETVQLALFRLAQAFSAVTSGPITETATEGVYTARALCSL